MRSPERRQLPAIEIQDGMTSAVTAYHDEEALVTIIEGLTEHRCGAVLITNAD